MTGLLQSIQRGRTSTPPRILVYGTEGIGKSTLAAQAPHPIFIQTEDGLGEIDCHKFPLSRTFDEVQTSLTSPATEDHEYETVVIDSADWLERLIYDDICKSYGVTSIERCDGGYGEFQPRWSDAEPNANADANAGPGGRQRGRRGR